MDGGIAIWVTNLINHEPQPELTRLLPASSDETKFLHRFRPYLVSSSTGIILVLLLAIRNRYDDSNEHMPSFVSSAGGTIRRENEVIRPGSIFSDTRGAPINAHGGGFLFHRGTYDWYGEIKSGETHLPASNADWGGTRVDLVGISCYSSSDLLTSDDPHHVCTATTSPSVRRSCTTSEGGNSSCGCTSTARITRGRDAASPRAIIPTGRFGMPVASDLTVRWPGI